eukprot:6818865-Prymnesium_polylepis.1
MRRERAQTRTWLHARGPDGGPLWQTSSIASLRLRGKPDARSLTANGFTPACFVLAAVSRGSRSFFR